MPAGVEELPRASAPRVLGALVRRHGDFYGCEEAVQEELIAAARQWPDQGVPGKPGSRLLTVARRRYADQVRSEAARRRREDRVALAAPAAELLAPAADEAGEEAADDSPALLFLCCHRDLSPPSRIALALRAVGGLATARVAAAFLVPEATTAQRISRAEQAVRAAGDALALPGGRTRTDRPAEVRHVLYLVFDEGYTASGGEEPTAPGLSVEAIRPARLPHRLVPEDTETAGLLALVPLTGAPRPARTGPGASRCRRPSRSGAAGTRLWWPGAWS